MTIDEIINRTVAIEGGYSNHPSDNGGETMFGITIATARANGYTGSMKDMPRPVALQIYRSEFFDRHGFNRVFEISPKVSEELFDTGVNVNPKRAATMLQEALNLCNQNGKLYPDLKTDGVIGSGTLSALRLILSRSRGEELILRVLNGLQFMWYVTITRNNPSQEVFFHGWTLNRVAF